MPANIPPDLAERLERSCMDTIYALAAAADGQILDHVVGHLLDSAADAACALHEGNES